MIKSTASPKPACTCWAVVGDSLPDGLALGATMPPGKATQHAAEPVANLWHPNRLCWQPGAGQRRDGAVRSPAQNQCQRAGPECSGQSRGTLVRFDDGKGALGIGKVRDQRVKAWPTFGGIDPGDSLALGGIRAQAVDGLRRKRHERTIAQQRLGEFQAFRGFGSQHGGAIQFKQKTRLLSASSPLEPAAVAVGVLFHRHGFGEVAGLVHVCALMHRCVIGQQLDWDRIQQRRDEAVDGWHNDDVFGNAA